MTTRLVIIGLWVTATYSLSRLFAAGRDGHVGLATVFWLAALAGSVFVLMLRMYAIERRRGHVKQPLALFERLLEKRG
jgi:hypothetical protein